MGNVINIIERINIHRWNEVYVHDGERTTLQVHVNEGTGELDVTLTNVEGEAINVTLSTVDSQALFYALKRAYARHGV